MHNNATTALTDQPYAITPKIQHTKKLEINGLIKTLDQRKLKFFTATDSFFAYIQHRYYTDSLNLFNCKSCCSEFYSGTQLTIAYPDESIEKINIKPSFFSSKEIAFDANNSEFIVLDNSDENSSLFLIKSQISRQNLDSKDKIEINLPKEHILVASISSNSDIYTVGIESNNLCLWTAHSPIKNNEDKKTHWEKLDLDLPDDSITEVAFSKNSRYLFVRLNTEQLHIYDCNSAWSRIAKIGKIKTLPADIANNPHPDNNSYDHIFTAFIKDKNTLIVYTENNRIFYYDRFSTELTAAYFIPKTNDLLIFDATGKIRLAKYEDMQSFKQPGSRIHNYNTTTLPYKILNAYFDSTNNKKLTVLAEKKPLSLIKDPHKATNELCSEIGTIISWPIYTYVTGTCISFSCLCSIVAGAVGGSAIDFIDGFFDKNYILKAGYCVDLKKNISLGDAIEEKALKTIQHPITRV